MGKIIKNGIEYGGAPLPIASSQVVGGVKVGNGLSIAPDGTLSAQGGSNNSVTFYDPDGSHTGTLRSIYSDNSGENQTLEFGFYNDEDERTYYKEITIPSSGGSGGGSKPVRSVQSIPENMNMLTKIFPLGTITIGSSDGLLIHVDGTVVCDMVGESETVSGNCSFDVYVPHSSINQYMWHHVTVPVIAKTQSGTTYQCSIDAAVRVDDNQSTGTTVVVMLAEDTLGTKITASALAVANMTQVNFQASSTVSEVITVCTDSLY